MTLLTIIFDIPLALINGILSFIPALSFPTSFTASINWLITTITPAGYVVDLNVMIQCIVTCLVMYNIGLIFEIFGWFVNFIPLIKKND